MSQPEKLEIGKIDQPDVKKISNFATLARAKTSDKLIKDLVLKPEQKELLGWVLEKGMAGLKLDYSRKVPADGDYLKDGLEELKATLVKSGLQNVLNQQGTVQTLELCFDNAEGKDDFIVDFCAYAYAYYLLQEVQKVSAEKKTTDDTYKLNVDEKGLVSVTFLNSTQPVPTADAAKNGADAKPQDQGQNVPDADKDKAKKEPEKKQENGLTDMALKTGKTLNDFDGLMKTILGPNILKLNFNSEESSPANIPADLNFGADYGKLLSGLGLTLGMALNNPNVMANLKGQLGNVLDGVDSVKDGEFVDYLAKASANYYMREVEKKVRTEYKNIDKMKDKIGQDPAKAVNLAYVVKVENGVATITLTPTADFTKAYAAVKETAPATVLDGDKARDKERMKNIPALMFFATLSGKGEALFDTVLNDQDGGFWGGMVALLAGMYGIGKFGAQYESMKSTVSSVSPAAAKTLEKFDKGIKQGVEKMAAEAAKYFKKSNAEIVEKADGKEFPIKGLAPMVGAVIDPKVLAMEFKEDLEPTTLSNGSYKSVEIKVPKGGTLTFGSEVDGKGIKRTDKPEPYNDKVTELTEGIYEITTTIPKGTKIPLEGSIKLAKKDVTTVPATDNNPPKQEVK